MRTLLEVVKLAPHINLFRMLLLFSPLVGCTHAQEQRLMEMEDSVRQWRAQLLQASEALKNLEKNGTSGLHALEHFGVGGTATSNNSETSRQLLRGKAWSLVD